MTNTLGILRPSVPSMPLGDLLAGIAVVPADASAIPVSDIVYDSRRAHAGCLYVGLAGAKTHGAGFAADAARSGAVALLTDAKGAGLAPDAGLPVIEVADPRLAMALAATRLFGYPTTGRCTFGVTGTTGKTTTCLMIDAALRAHGRHCGYIGTLGFTVDGVVLPTERTTITTPESADLQAALAVMAQRGADSYVMEATSSGLLMDRVDGVEFDVVGFTNLGRDHMDIHGTIEDYFQAKAKLFRAGWARHAMINVDDPAGQRLAAMVADAGDPALITVGHDETADYHIVETFDEGDHQKVVFVNNGQTVEFPLDMPGAFNVSNAMMALAMMDAAGFSREDTLRGLHHVKAPGRMMRVELDDDAPRVYIDFAHTPEATEAVLDTLTRPMIAVLGAGGDRDPGKRAPLGRTAARFADIVVVTDDNYRSEDPATIRAAIWQGANEQAESGDHPVTVHNIGGRPEAVKQALAMAGPQWNVVILGRGVEEFQEAGDQHIPMRDADLVRRGWDELRQEHR